MVDINSGTTAKIISRAVAESLLDDDDPRQRVHIFIRNGPAQIESADRLEQIRHAPQFAAGTVITGLRPQGNAIHARAAGSGTTTVETHLVTPATWDVDGEGIS